MNRLYAPWRESYITGLDKKKSGCVFCSIQQSSKDKENFVFLRDQYCFAVLNLYPYSNGHCLVLPNRHVGDISKLKPVELAALMSMTVSVKELMSIALKPIGYNLGMNLGRMAGAGIPGHIHMHIVPRWKGDHNFMPITAEARVISQSLKLVHQSLIKAKAHA